MTKEITKTIILQQLQDRMGLREFAPAPFLFDETVIPTFDIGGEFQTIEIEYEQVSITEAGAALFFSVPEDEAWRLTRYTVVFMGAGAYTVSGVYWRKLGEPENFMYLDLTAAQSTSYHVNIIHPPRLPPRAYLYVNVDGYTSTQNLRLYIEYIKETIR